MKSLKEIVEQQQARRQPNDDPVAERLFAEVLLLAEEVCVLRDRLETAEVLSADGRPVNAGAIDAYEPNDEQVSRRLEKHRAFYERLFSRLNESGST